MGERQAKNENKTRLVNKANRPQMLIKDGMVSLISKLIYSKCQVTSGQRRISFSRGPSKEDTVKSNGLHEE